LSHPVANFLPNLPSFPIHQPSELIKVLQDLNITEIHTHGLVDFLPDSPDYLVDIVRATRVRWEVNLHDYKVICPRINLVDGNDFYCGEPSEALCDKCLSTHGSSFGVTCVRDWRAMHYRALLEADQVLVPDHDVSERLKKYFPDIHFEVSPHEKINPEQLRVPKPQLASNERLRVVIIGAIGKIKGFDVLLACARDAVKRKLPIDFIVMGYSMNDPLLSEAGAKITGRYLDADANEVLSSLSPHVVWLPSIWPETYSYTLSIALDAGLSVYAFDLGAIARRIRECDPDAQNHLLPLGWGNEPKLINDCFMRVRSS
jgi:glycosyltransferase involved in cell wall biosynthesis